jgi:hypothetical protein
MNWRWLKVVEKIAPLVLAATPLAPIVPFVILGIQTAEQIPGATGEQKLALATQIVNTGVAATNAQVGHTEIDPALVNDAVTHGIATVVAAVNLKHTAEAEDAGEKNVA